MLGLPCPRCQCLRFFPPPNFVFSDRNGEFTLFSARSGGVPITSGPLWQATIASVRMLPLGGGGLRYDYHHLRDLAGVSISSSLVFIICWLQLSHSIGARQWISILSTILRRSLPMCLWFSHMARFFMFLVHRFIFSCAWRFLIRVDVSSEYE